MLQITRHVRKAFVVQAVQVTAENMEEVAAWCGGTILIAATNGARYIRVNVKNAQNERQTMAFIGSWILLADNGYKVFANKPFISSYDEFYEAACGLVSTTADGNPCVLGAGHRSAPVATGCRSLQDYKVISPASPIVRQIWVDPNLECI